MRKEEIKRKLEFLNKRIYHATNGINETAANIAALASYIRRHMDEPRRADFALKWLTKIAESIYYDNAGCFHEIEEFGKIYGIDYYELCMNEDINIKLGHIRAYMTDYSQAIRSLGEVVCSIKVQEEYASQSAEIEHNLKEIEKINGTQLYR